MVITTDHYNSLIETVHLLKSATKAAYLARSIEQFKSVQVVVREILDDYAVSLY